MPYMRYALWKWILDDRALWLLILVCALGIGAVVGFLVRNRSKSGAGVVQAIIFALVSIPFLWWYLLTLVDHKTGLPTPAGFDFVKEVAHGKSTCARVKESALVIEITFCGIADVLTQERVIVEIQRERPSTSDKPVVVTFRTNVAWEEHHGARFAVGYRLVRQELLPSRTNIRSQGDAPTAARA